MSSVCRKPNATRTLFNSFWLAAYTTYWNCAEKKGYSGSAIFTRSRPLKVVPQKTTGFFFSSFLR